MILCMAGAAQTMYLLSSLRWGDGGGPVLSIRRTPPQATHRGVLAEAAPPRSSAGPYSSGENKIALQFRVVPGAAGALFGANPQGFKIVVNLHHLFSGPQSRHRKPGPAIH